MVTLVKATVDEHGPGERKRIWPLPVAPHEPPTSAQKEYLDVRRVLRTLMREWWFVLTPALLILGLVVGYLIVTNTQYTASAQLLIDIQKPKIIAGEVFLPGLDMSRNMIGPVIDSEVEILRSPHFAARVIRNLELDKSEAFIGGFSLRRDVTRAIKSVFRWLMVPFGLSDPQSSQADVFLVPPALIEKFQSNLNVRRQGLSLILLVEYTDTNPRLAARVANASVNQYLAEQLRSKLDAAIKIQNRLQERVAELREEVRLGQQRIQDYAVANDLVSFGGLTISEREISATLVDLVAARGATTGQDHAIAVERVKLIERTLADLKRKHAKRKQLAIRLSELEQDFQSANAIYKALQARLKETHVQMSLLSPDARIISSAATPQRPSAPKKSILLILGLVGGLGVGITLALIRDHMLDVVRSPDDVEAATNLSHITSIPALTPSTDAFRIVIHDAASQMSQAIFLIKHAILNHPAQHAPRIVAVASSNTGEGKSTIAANLAHYMALSGTRTLLIDCDLRTPDLTGHFLPNPSRSVVDILSGECKPGDVIVQLKESGLFFCPGPHGKIVENPMELMVSPKMPQFFSLMAKKYEMVILDTSAMLPVVDARALIDSVDATVLVVEEMRTSSTDLKQLTRLVPALTDKAVGTVMNKSQIEA